MLQLSESKKATLRWIFQGRDGIRAGWRVVIFLATFLLIAAVVGLTAHFILHNLLHIEIKPKAELSPWHELVNKGVSLLILLGACLVMARIEGRRWWEYGLVSRRAVTHFVAGWVGGFLCLSVLVGSLYHFGYLVFDGVAQHGTAAIGYGLVLLTVFFMVGVLEESLFRGYVQSALTRGIGFWPAAVVTSLLFAGAHTGNPGELLLGIVSVFMAGMVFCLLLRVSGSLWLGIGFHTAWDWAQSFFYSTPDSGYMFKGHLLISHATGNVGMSGGTVGPEGSYLLTPVLVIGLLLLVAVGKATGLFSEAEATK